MLLHEKCWSSHPPTIGPVATATPMVAPHSPIACARCLRSVNTLVISDKVGGKTMAAPRPMNARAGTSAPTLDVSPPATLAVPKMASPANSQPLRPNRSDRLPAVSRRAANTRL